MSRPVRIGIIGLGSIGQRMLRHAAAHPRVNTEVVYDPEPSRVDAALAADPARRAARCPTALIQDPDIDVVYIASPPVTHAEHAHAALDAGRPVLCEKPLGVDLAASRALVEHARSSGVANAINFIYATAQPAVVMARALRDGELGELVAVDVVLHLRAWAQRRYAEAPWLAGGAQGGFAREVLSHHLFLCERLLGPARLEDHDIGMDPVHGTLTRLQARLRCAEVPVYVRGDTNAAAPDVVEMTLWGTRASLCAHDLYRIRRGTPAGWEDESVSGDPAADWHRRQYDALADMVTGAPHTLPDFAAACEVQALVEALMGS